MKSPFSNPTAAQLTFRAWLVKQLTVSRWAAPRLNLSTAELARHLGVTAPVLREAMALRNAELKKRGKSGVAMGGRRYVSHDYAEVILWMPGEVYKDWAEVCTALRVEPSTVLRSLVHHFLLDPKKPSTVRKRWHYRNQILLTRRATRKSTEARISRGAQVALDYHADLWDATPAGLVRGLVKDFLEGRTLKIKMVGFDTMWGDPDRYLHPERFT